MGVVLKPVWRALGIALLLGGCSAGADRFRPRVPPATTARDLAAVDISGVAVTRWQDIANDLEPNFTVDHQKLLDDGIPVTATASERILDSLVARLGVSVSGTVIDKARTSTAKSSISSASSSDANGAVSSTGSSSDSSGTDSSDMAKRSTPSLPALPDAAIGAGAAPQLSGTRATPVTSDAVTRAANAAGVIQSIVQINRSIRDAVRMSGYEPYLIHLAVGMHSRLRDQPFDVLIRLTFLPHHVDEADLNEAYTSLVDPDGQIGPTAPMASNSRAYGAFSDMALDEKARMSFEQRCRKPDFEGCFGENKDTLRGLLDREFVTVGMLEDPRRYHFELAGAPDYVRYARGEARYVDDQGKPIAWGLTMDKDCFFPVVARYIRNMEMGEGSKDDKLTASRTYAMFTNAARFSAGFYEQFQRPVHAGGCTNEFYASKWREIYNRRRLQIPRVVPLVQTEILEGSQDRSVAEQLREAAVTLSALAGPAALTGNLNKTLDRIEEYETTRFNTLYSISQIAPNTVIVKLGARRLGRRFEMQDAPVQVSVLLLVPREQAGDKIEIVARPSFVNAETGQTLALTGPAGQDGDYVSQDLADDACLATSPREPFFAPTMACRRLLTYVAKTFVEPGDWAGFNAYLGALGRRPSNSPEHYFVCSDRDRQEHDAPPVAPSGDSSLSGREDRACVLGLWAGLQREISRIRLTPTAMTELPQVTARNLPPMQTAILRTKDDNMSVSVSGIDPWLKPYLRATLSTTCLGRKTGDVSVMATALTIENNVGTFAFPAVGFGNDDKGAAVPASKQRLCLWIDEPSYTPAVLASVDGFSAINPEVYPLAAIAGSEPKPKPAFTLAAADQQVAVKADGTATIRIVIEGIAKAPKPFVVKLAVNGSVIGPVALAKPGFTAEVGADGGYSLDLAGLDPTQPIKVTATRKDDASAPAQTATIATRVDLAKTKEADK